MMKIFKKNEKTRLVKGLFGFQWFSNLRIGVKLTLSFAMVALIAGVVGLVGTMNIYRISRAGQEVYQENIAVLGPLHNVSAQLLKVRLNTAYHVMETKDKFRYENAIKSSKRSIDQQLADFEKGDYKIGERLTSLTNAFNSYWQEEAVVLELSNENKTAEATEHINQNLNSLATLIDSIMSGLFDMSNQDGKLKTEANRLAANQTIGFMLVMVLIGIIAALGLGLVISRMISKPLKQLTTAAEQVAAGDLNVTITPIDAKDETAALTNSFANMTNSLHQLVSGINEDSQTLGHASRELKNAANDTGKSAAEVAKTMEELARASSEQASQNNEAVNSINDLADLVRQVSSEVNNIVAESQKVSEIAKLGQKATRDVAEEIVKIYDMTRDVTGVITELDQATAEISSITDIIQGVAEQTALLALNASIEAARAGEHGRGFGVVATETGKLAEQTKQAAQLISDGLTKISQRSRQVVQSMDNGMAVVESGKNLAADATVTFGDIFQQLDNILKRIDRVAYSAQNMATRNEGMIAIITNIAALSQESMAGTEEVSASTEEQSASVEQVNAMAENLAVISGKLQQTVAQFKIS